MNQQTNAAILDMLWQDKQPACLTALKSQSAAKGPFVGYTTVDHGRFTHKGTGQDVFAVITRELVKDSKHADSYRLWVKERDLQVDRLIAYTEMLEAIIKERVLNDKLEAIVKERVLHELR